MAVQLKCRTRIENKVGHYFTSTVNKYRDQYSEYTSTEVEYTEYTDT